MPSDLSGVSDLRPRQGRLHLPPRPDVRPGAAGRRDQPRQPQDPERAAGGDGGKAGHGRRRDPRPALALLRDRHPEPARPAGHLRPARVAAGPLPDAHLAGLPRPRRRARAAQRRGPARAWSSRCTRTLTPIDLQALQQQVQQVHAAEPLLNYVQDLVAATRSGRWFLQGLSPRAGIAVVRAAKAQALLAGRDYVAPDDVQAILPQTVAHRLIPVGDAGRGAGRAGARHDGGGAAALSCHERRGPRTPFCAAPAGRFRKWWQARLPLSDTLDADPAQRLHPAHAARLHAGRHAAGAAGRLDQLPAQPGLPADLPAGRQRAWWACTCATPRCAA